MHFNVGAQKRVVWHLEWESKPVSGQTPDKKYLVVAGYQVNKWNFCSESEIDNFEYW